jgi:flagellin
MATINTNMPASIAANSLTRNDRSMTATMERLSTGLRINSAKDDAAGLAISSKMTSQINGLGAAVKNANDAVSMIATAEGALDEVTEMLQRMRELAVQAGTGSMSSDDRTYLNNEFAALRSEIDRIADNTEWNGNTILNGTAGGTSASSVTFQVGVDGGQTIAVDFGNITDASGGDMNGISASVITGTTAASGQTNATSAITALDTAIEAVSTQRSAFGAGSNRLEHAIDNLTNVQTNAEASRSRILDTDYAQSTSELARTQIIQQAGTAMLAQANQLPQTVLALLQ